MRKYLVSFRYYIVLMAFSFLFGLIELIEIMANNDLSFNVIFANGWLFVFKIILSPVAIALIADIISNFLLFKSTFDLHKTLEDIDIQTIKMFHKTSDFHESIHNYIYFSFKNEDLINLNNKLSFKSTLVLTVLIFMWTINTTMGDVDYSTNIILNLVFSVIICCFTLLRIKLLYALYDEYSYKISCF